MFLIGCRAGGGDGGQGSGGGGGDDARPGLPKEVRARAVEAIRLLRQYLQACLVRYSIISVPKVSADGGDVELLFYQILECETKKIFVTTFKTADDLAAEEGLFNVTVQPFARQLTGGFHKPFRAEP